MRSILLVFVPLLAMAFWTVDKLDFDGEYTAKIWKQSNSLGAQWQKDARQWVKRSF
jgi:hypothetical protein